MGSEETKGYSKAISMIQHATFLRQWYIFHVTGQAFTYLLWVQVTFKLSFSGGGRRKCNITFR